MSRLTTRMSIMGRKHDIEGGQAHHWKKLLKDYDYQLIEEAVDKLGELEDIEDRLGCPLETVFKALTYGVYANIPDITNGIEFFKPILRLGSIIGDRWRFIVLREGKGNNFPLYLDCLGKTWALTEEGLGK